LNKDWRGILISPEGFTLRVVGDVSILAAGLTSQAMMVISSDLNGTTHFNAPPSRAAEQPTECDIEKARRAERASLKPVPVRSLVRAMVRRPFTHD